MADFAPGQSPFAGDKGELPPGVSPVEEDEPAPEFGKGESPFTQAGPREPGWLERHGIVQPGSPIATKGVLGVLRDAPGELLDYLRNTPSALEQSRHVWRRVW